MSVFKLETGKVARELRVVVLEDPDDFNSRTEDLPPGVHVVDMPGNNLVVLSNKSVYQEMEYNKGVWVPLTYHNGTRVGRVSKVVAGNGFGQAMVLLQDRRTLWASIGMVSNDKNGVLTPRDRVVDMSLYDAPFYKFVNYYPMLANVSHKFIPLGVKINDVSWLGYACCAALSNETILVWGRVDLMRPPQTRGVKFATSGGLKILSVPRMRPGGKIVSLASGDEHIVWVVKHADEEGGCVYVYGNNRSGQCGVVGMDYCEPMKITAPELCGVVKGVQCGRLSSYALTVDGRIFVWGRGNGDGMGARNLFGIPPTEILPPPKKGAIWLKMATGFSSSIALYGSAETGIGGAVTWGKHDQVPGRADNSTNPRDIDFSPELMELLLEEDPKFVNLASSYHTAHIIFTRDDFSFQEFDEEDVEARLDYGSESGMYERVERNKY